MAVPQSEKQLAKLLCAALRDWCQADCALVNDGLILAPLPEGKVTSFDLLQICPHPINPAVLHLSGKELTAILTHAREDKWLSFHMHGFGFRGTMIGRFYYENISFKKDDIYVNDKIIASEKMYTLAVPDMFTFGQVFPEISAIKNKHYMLPDFLRDILAWRLSQEEIIF